MRKPNRELREVTFYYKHYNQLQVVVEVKKCKQPQRTNVWSELQNMLDNDESIENVGYVSNSINN